jgi:uncharacterized protein (DUF885 family)
VFERSVLLRVPVCLALLGSLLSISVPLPAGPPSVNEALAALAGLPFDAFLDEAYRQIILRDPDTIWASELQSYYGLASFAEWTDLSMEAFAETCRLDTEILSLLHSYDRELLTEKQRIHYDSYEWYLEDRIRRHPYPYWDYVIGPSSYGVHNLALEVLACLPIDSLQAAEDYIERLDGTKAWMDQLIAAFGEREAHGVIPSLTAIDYTLSDLDSTFPLIDDARLAHTLDPYTTFVDRIDRSLDIPESTRDALLSEAEAAIARSLIPAFRELRDYVASLRVRPGSVGVHGYEDAEAYFAVQLEHYVTKPTTPEEVTALGEREVARIQADMHAYAETELGWPTGLSMGELDARLTAANVPVLEGQPLLAEYQRLVDEATAALPTVFEVFPESELIISVEPGGPPAYYREPPIDKSAPGMIPTSLMSVISFTAYDEPVLMHHEGNPGHHYQLALQRDMELPALVRDRVSSTYIRHPVFQSFAEGWALYAEQLAYEMGLYDDDPIGVLCQKRLELVRLVRLVADPGLNAFGWTWSETARYLQDETGRTTSPTEALRYGAYPGQLCACVVGYLTFLELRGRAEEALGDDFDVREFHRVILENGAMPLEVLERVVDDWLAEKTAST